MCYKPDSSTDWKLRKSQTSGQIQPLHPTFCSLLCLPIVTFSGALPWGNIKVVGIGSRDLSTVIHVLWLIDQHSRGNVHSTYSVSFLPGVLKHLWSSSHCYGVKRRWKHVGVSIRDISKLQTWLCDLWLLIQRFIQRISTATIVWMILSPAMSIQSNHLLLLRNLFKFRSSGFSSSFPFDRVTLTTVTLRWNLVKQDEYIECQVRWHLNCQDTLYVL